MLQNHAVLEFEEAPLLGFATKLRFSFQFSEDKQDVEAVIHLAEGIELIEGELFWQGNLPQSVEKTLEITIKVNETGHFRIQGTVDFSNGFPVNVQDTVDIEVTSQGTFMETRPVNYWEQTIGYALPANQDQLSSELVIEPKPALDETFTLIYRVKPLLEVFPQNMQANLVLPEHAFEVLAAQFPQEGESQQSGMQFIWTGSPHEGETIEIQLTLKAITTGWGPIFATSFVSEGGAIQQGITDTLLADLYVGEYAGGYTIGEP